MTNDEFAKEIATAYMTEELYHKLSGEKPEINAVITTLSDSSEESREALAKTLTERDGVLALSFSQDEMENFSKTIENMNYVVILIIACAAALAFIVLYTLTSININERRRELATLKVLGFYDRESTSYVGRENYIITALAIVAGIGFGFFLHKIVVAQAEVNVVMFGRIIEPMSYLYAVGMTLLFAVIVNVVMHFYIKKIDMVESLKSID